MATNNDYYNKFQEYYSLYINRIQYYAYNYLNNKEEAVSVAQNSFMKLWEHRDKIDYADDVLPYLITVTKNECLTLLKKNRSKERYSSYIKYREYDINIYALNHNSSAELLSKELNGLINCTLELMPPKIRETFLLSRNNKLKNYEIAQVQNISLSTVEYRIKKAYQYLRKYLKDYLPLFLWFFV